jgi:hypothetical protein
MNRNEKKNGGNGNGPNDTSSVIWALGEVPPPFFFAFSVLTNVLILQMNRNEKKNGGDENGPNDASSLVWALVGELFTFLSSSSVIN